MMHEDLERAVARREDKRAAEERFRQEASVDKFARAFCHRYGISWGGISLTERDDMRDRVEELLTYIDSTGFRAFLPTTDVEDGRQS